MSALRWEVSLVRNSVEDLDDVTVPRWEIALEMRMDQCLVLVWVMAMVGPWGELMVLLKETWRVLEQEFANRVFSRLRR